MEYKCDGHSQHLEVVKKLDTVKVFSYPLINVIKIKSGFGVIEKMMN